MEGNPIGDLTGCRGRLAGQANRPAWLAPPVEPEFTLKGNPIGATLQAAHGGGKPYRQPNKPHKAEGNPVGDPTGCRGRLAGQTSRPAGLAPLGEPQCAFEGNPIGDPTGCRGRLAGQANLPAGLATPYRTSIYQPCRWVCQAAYPRRQPYRQPYRLPKVEANPTGNPTSRPK